MAPSPTLSAIATGIGLFTDKYMLEATNFVTHYTRDSPVMRMTHEQDSFIKSAMYAGAIAGMLSFGPLSDVLGRRVCLILCSMITTAGALLSMFAWSADSLIAARIVTGIGMGGEYPLASTHSAESGSSKNGARNVALLYLFGSGGGPAICGIFTYVLDLAGVPERLIWRGIFCFGSVLSFTGLLLRFYTTRDTKQFVRAHRKDKGIRRNFLKFYWRPLLGASLSWMLFDVVEYGLKQNDAAIFAAGGEGPYRNSVLTVFFTRLLVIPSLIIAPMLLNMFSAKWVQTGGFAGCVVANLLLASEYNELHKQDLTHIILFDSLYVIQLSFQSLPGVTIMATSAQMFPAVVKGTCAAISAACGKVGAVLGSYFFTLMKDSGLISEIFWVVTGTSTAAMFLTLLLIPNYSGGTLDMAEALAEEGDVRAACRTLYSGPQEPAAESKDASNDQSDFKKGQRAGVDHEGGCEKQEVQDDGDEERAQRNDEVIIV